MKSQFLSIGLALCIGMFISVTGQAEQNNALPVLPDISAEPSLELPPELQNLERADTPPLSPELEAESPLPDLLQEIAIPPELNVEEQESAPDLQLESSAKSVQEQMPVITIPVAMPSYDISLFNHKFHVEKAGFACTDCHNSIFQQSAGAAKAKGNFNMAAFAKGKYCGTCHDGSTAFAVTDQGSCVRCHGSDMKQPK